MKKLPIGIQTFSALIDGGYLYVDKTKEIHQLIESGGKYYFLSRPRRFGKSLLLSTIGEIFKGNRQLFEGLWIHDKIKWEPHPIIHIDFLGLTYDTNQRLVDTLNYLIDKNARLLNIQLTENGYDKRFKELIEKAAKDKAVVILIDEYDKPIIDHVENKEIAQKNRNTLRSFYGSIKGSDQFIRFAFITGVSKFSKVSVFSDLNNLRDITLSDAFSTMLGYTESELHTHFEKRVEKLVPKMKKESSEILADIKRWYNGYSWDAHHFVYNPFSILNFFQEERFGNYWFSTGTPTFLIKLIKEKRIDVKRIGFWQADENGFDSYDIDNMDVTSLLFQTGYITIKTYKTLNEIRKYYLEFPNREVKDSFLKYLLADFVDSSPGTLGSQVFDLSVNLLEKRPDEFFRTLETLFAGIPHEIFIKDKEAYYHSVIYLVLTLLGININCQVQTNVGRIDAVIEVENTVYILEFKMGTPQTALKQIKERKYYEKFRAPGKEILLVGVGFDVDKRNLSGYITEPLTN